MTSPLFRRDKFTSTVTQSLLYSDFMTNFNAHPDLGDIVVLTNEKAVMSAIKNLLKTNKYERRFQPTLGSNLEKFLFEPISAATQQNIQDEIATTINNHEPRAKLISVVVTPYEEQHAYAITITFYLVNSTNPITLNTILYRIR